MILVVRTCQNLDGLGDITREEISAWIDTNIVVPDIPIIKDIVPLFLEEIFLVFDVQGNNDKINWADITKYIDTIEDSVTPAVDVIQDFISRFQNFCTSDSECSGSDEYCNVLQFSCLTKKPNGFFPCIKDSQCSSDRCTDIGRTCEALKANGAECLADKECSSGVCAWYLLTGRCGSRCTDCGSNEVCNSNYSPDICFPKLPNDSSCASDSECESDRCVDTTRLCKAKKLEGKECFADKECASGECKWNWKKFWYACE